MMRKSIRFPILRCTFSSLVHSETTRPQMPLREVFPYTPKKVRHLSRTQHLKPFFGKPVRLARKGKRGKTNADYGANRYKAEGNRSWGEEENRGRGGNRRKGLSRAWALGGVAAMRMSFGQKTKGRPGQDGPLEIKSWRCSTFPRKNAQYHRRWRA